MARRGNAQHHKRSAKEARRLYQFAFAGALLTVALSFLWSIRTFHPANVDKSTRDQMIDKWANSTAEQILEDLARTPFEAAQRVLATITSPPYSGYSAGNVSELSGGERGLFAVKDLEKGEVVLRVPRTATYSQDDVPSALGSIVGVSRGQRAGVDFQRIGMGLGLLYELSVMDSNKDTKGWLHNRLNKTDIVNKDLLRNWIASFPDTFDSVIRFTANHTSLLFGPATYPAKRLDSFLGISTGMAALMPSLFGVKSMESEDEQVQIETLSRWAWGLVLSRGHLVTVTEETGLERDLVLLAPGLDFVNHRASGWNVGAPECSADECVVRTVEPVANGTELTMSYGRYSNLRLLIHYGFEIPENDQIGYYLDLNHTRLHPEYQVGWIGAEPAYSKCRKNTYVVGDEDDWNTMVTCARLVQHTPDSDKSFVKAMWMNSHFESLPAKLSARDVEAMSVIAQNCRDRVEEISNAMESISPSAFESDEDPLSMRLLNAVKQEMAVTKKWLDRAEKLIV